MSKKKTESKPKPKPTRGETKPLVYGPIHKPSGEKKVNPEGKKN